MQHISMTDPKEKTGEYVSVGAADGVRVYLDQAGYESVLPHVYNLTQHPPVLLRNITTPFGLASLSPGHPRSS